VGAGSYLDVRSRQRQGLRYRVGMVSPGREGVWNVVSNNSPSRSMRQEEACTKSDSRRSTHSLPFLPPQGVGVRADVGCRGSGSGHCRPPLRHSRLVSNAGRAAERRPSRALRQCFNPRWTCLQACPPAGRPCPSPAPAIRPRPSAWALLPPCPGSRTSPPAPLVLPLHLPQRPSR
jgi:hypothetical protein